MSKDKSSCSDESSKCSGRCRGASWFIMLLLILAGCGWFFYHQKKMAEREAQNLAFYDRVNETVQAMEKQIASVNSEVSDLSEKIKTNHRCDCTEQCLGARATLRKKWKTWLTLRAKMEANEPFDEELKQFNELFSCDKELIDLVEELAKGMDVVSSGKNGSVVGVYKNMLNKIVKLKKINHKKLAEISGYVLSSVCNCSEELTKNE